MPKKPKILILSWEYYPVYAGGLGMLVKSVADELVDQGATVETWLPMIPPNLHLERGVSLEKLVKKHLRLDKPIPNLDFSLERFVNKPNSSKPKWPRLFPKPAQTTSSSFDLYPNNTPTVTKAYAWAVAEQLKKSPDWDYIICMDWQILPTIYLLKSQGLKIPMYPYINSTEYDRGLSNAKQSDTQKKITQLEISGINLGDHIFAVSDFTKKILTDQYQIPHSKITPILNDIEFTPSSESFKDLNKDKTVLFLGRFAAQKGINFLLEAATRLVSIDPQIQFILAGDGELLPETIEHIAARNLEKNLWITGWLDTEEKKRLYRSVSLFVMPSPSEPFGLTAFEAIRSGVPVIASENAGFTSVITTTPTFKYYDVDHFTNLCLKYIHNAQAQNELLQKQAQELEKHNWSEQIKYFLDILNQSKPSND